MESLLCTFAMQIKKHFEPAMSVRPSVHPTLRLFTCLAAISKIPSARSGIYLRGDCGGGGEVGSFNFIPKWSASPICRSYARFNSYLRLLFLIFIKSFFCDLVREKRMINTSSLYCASPSILFLSIFQNARVRPSS